MQGSSARVELESKGSNLINALDGGRVSVDFVPNPSVRKWRRPSTTTERSRLLVAASVPEGCVLAPRVSVWLEAVREAAEAIAAAQARAAATGRSVHVSFVADSDGVGKADGGTAASAEPELRRVTALRTRRRVPVAGAELGSDGVRDGARGGARRSWSSAWNEATDTTTR